MDNRVHDSIRSELEKSKYPGIHKQKLTATRIYEIFKAEVFDIGKTTILNQVKEKRHANKEAYIRREYPLWHRAELDFG